jgi:hypothetical protein
MRVDHLSGLASPYLHPQPPWDFVLVCILVSNNECAESLLIHSEDICTVFETANK